MIDHIQIKIAGKRISPDKFLDGARDFFALVEGVARNVTNTPISWMVEADNGSAIVRMRIENPTSESEKPIHAVCHGLRSLKTGLKMVPSGFTRNEVSAARRLAKLIDGETVQSVSIQNGGEPEELTVLVADTADAILSGQGHSGEEDRDSSARRASRTTW